MLLRRSSSLPAGAFFGNAIVTIAVSEYATVRSFGNVFLVREKEGIAASCNMAAPLPTPAKADVVSRCSLFFGLELCENYNSTLFKGLRPRGGLTSCFFVAAGGWVFFRFEWCGSEKGRGVSYVCCCISLGTCAAGFRHEGTRSKTSKYLSNKNLVLNVLLPF